MAALSLYKSALAAALLARCVLGDVSAKVAQKRRASSADGPAPSDFSLLSPDPSLLAWDNVSEADGLTSLHGWLRVPLSHAAAAEAGASSPHVCLRVSAYTSSKSPQHGHLLAHCGGPGSGRDCALQTMDSMKDIRGDFAFLGIDQRGVPLQPDAGSMMDVVNLLMKQTWNLAPDCSFSEESGEPVLPFPEMKCDAIYERLENLSYDEQSGELRNMLADFLGGDAPAPSEDEMDVIFSILSSGGLPVDGTNGVSYMNETYVRWFYRLVSLEQNLCVASPRFQRASPTGRAFNALAFAGTGELARDIEVFRRAINADKLSLAGYSYGTVVAPTYATLFPERVGRTVVDGVVTPERDLLSFLIPYNKGFFSVWQGIMTDCSSSDYQGLPEDSRCPLAPGPSSKVLRMVNDKSNLTRASIVANLFIQATVDITFAPFAVDYAARAHAGEGAPEWCEVLPTLCDATAPGRGEPIGPSKSGDRFHVTMIAGVLSMDISGRLSEESLISWWRDSLETFPFGTARGITLAANMASWPLYSKPLPPPGRDGMQALVIGNLHDAQTDYTGAQKMRAAYPESALMTWQGYGHCLPGESNVPAGSNLAKQQNDLALDMCKAQVTRYLSSGELPPDGHICVLDEPVGLGNSSMDLEKAFMTILINTITS